MLATKLVSTTIATTIFCKLALILLRLLPFLIIGPSFPSLGLGGVVALPTGHSGVGFGGAVVCVVAVALGAAPARC